MSAKDELIKHARFLRNAAPQQFVDFQAAFVMYTNEQLQDLVKATDRFPQMQGHAQQCKAILDILDQAGNSRWSQE